MEESTLTSSSTDPDDDDDIYVAPPSDNSVTLRPKLAKNDPAKKRQSHAVINLTHTDELYDATPDKSVHGPASKAPASRKSSKKFGLDDFTLLKVLGKGSFGKVMI